MTQDNDTVTTEASDEADESAVIKALRKENRELLAELKSRPDRDALAAELRTELERDRAIQSELEHFGHPAGILDAVKAKLGEGAVSREAVAAALQGIGYTVDVEGAGSDQGEVESQPLDDLAQVTSLASQVRATASNVSPASVVDKVSGAKTREELIALAAEGGFLVGS